MNRTYLSGRHNRVEACGDDRIHIPEGPILVCDDDCSESYERQKLEEHDEEQSRSERGGLEQLSE